MARIESYPAAPSPISGADKLIGTDSANNNETKNFSIQEIADFVGFSPYKVYTALLTQNGGDTPLTTGSFNGGPSKDSDGFNIGISYQITANPNNTDLSIYGAPNNLEGTSFVSIYSSNLSDDNLDVDVIFSFNAGAPKVTVLENTIGNIWFTYESMGTFVINSDGLFTQYKTYITPQICGEDQFAPLIGVVKYNTNSQVYLFAMSSNGALYDGPISPSFNLYSSIEIKVYN